VHLATRQYAETIVVTLAGRIDHQTAGSFEAALDPLLTQAATGLLVLDMAGVDYISSVGLRVLMIAAKRTRESQSRLAVAALGGVVAEIFKISRFDRLLTVVPTMGDALALASPAAQAQYRAQDPAPGA
jgi:anti-anti-sigma factor